MTSLQLFMYVCCTAYMCMREIAVTIIVTYKHTNDESIIYSQRGTLNMHWQLFIVRIQHIQTLACQRIIKICFY